MAERLFLVPEVIARPKQQSRRGINRDGFALSLSVP
jgi:hypothetical protein